jgi:hypothetical protein
MEGTISLAYRAVFDETRTCSLEPVGAVGDDPTEESGRFFIYVLFTEMRETRAALRSAESLSTGLPAALALLVPLTVPYPLPLNRPPVPLDFAARRIAELADAVTMKIRAYVYLCRDPEKTIQDALNPHSVVVIGTGLRWYFNKSERMARKLRRQGHDVVLANYRYA